MKASAEAQPIKAINGKKRSPLDEAFQRAGTLLSRLRPEVSWTVQPHMLSATSSVRFGAFVGKGAASTGLPEHGKYSTKAASSGEVGIQDTERLQLGVSNEPSSSSRQAYEVWNRCVGWHLVPGEVRAH